MAEKWLSGDIKRNPLGWFIALVMFVMFLWMLSSESGISPINNSTIANNLGCSTCVNGGPGGAYEVLKPFGVMFYVALPVIIGLGYLTFGKNERPRIEPEEYETEEMDESDEAEDGDGDK